MCPPPRPRVPQPPAAYPAPGPSRAEDRHGVPETKSRLLAHRPHCSHRAASGPPFQRPQPPQIAAFPRGGNGDPASPATGPRAAFPGPDFSRESRLVDSRDLVSAPFSFSPLLSVPVSLSLPPSAPSLSCPERAFCRAKPYKSQTSPERKGWETELLLFFPKRTLFWGLFPFCF